MGFHKYRADANGQGRPGKNRDEFTLAAGDIPLPARLLDRMGRIIHHRAAGLGQNGQRAHVGNERVIAERCAAFTEHHPVITGRLGFLHDIRHVPRGKKLALFDIQGFTGFSGGDDQIGLAAQKCGNLDDVHGLRNRGTLIRQMDIGQYRAAMGFAYFGEDRQAFSQPHATQAVQRCPVRLIERAFIG